MEIDRERLARAFYKEARRQGYSGGLEEVEIIDALLADISAQGFVIAPREPSKEMIEAAMAYTCTWFEQEYSKDAPILATFYTAMIHAIEASR